MHYITKVPKKYTQYRQGYLYIILLSLFQVVKQGITKTGAKEYPAPLPLLLS